MGRRFRPEETLIIGDSLCDIFCAQAHCIACLAVAIGRALRLVVRQVGSV